MEPGNMSTCGPVFGLGTTLSKPACQGPAAAGWRHAAEAEPDSTAWQKWQALGHMMNLPAAVSAGWQWLKGRAVS